MNVRRLKLGDNGRISIPAAYRRELGVRAGDQLVARFEDGELRLTTPNLALERARRVIDRYIKDDEDLTDRLIAERRAEAARE
jgi:AbrB family looped-hinge helix DNA binding protein